ncbi:tripartite tricarboxylate transporter TctB family protein [Pseudorhizobium pelagicum]|uniref:DUF1468 domain-containing protein n=1 Tax=Pseudorhizobium pelagicum TaxID=1509405 RepID=A0A922NWW3_9HYPH|nr:tripartite tricarboxylate transporter TctB family protein [Pseudorhizobium pelagicum]KEQ04197.1 hypothetical protein GV67_10985 [Pseudorhizobium pelagicum]KEQ04446.1 hypothetical protein GV68_13295 [Pseudorhizobium pelagicum]
MNITHQDTVSGLVLVALALAVVWLSLDMGTGAGAETLSPNFVPLVCAVGLGACGVVLTLRGLRQAGRFPALLDRRVGMVLAVLIPFMWFFGQIDVRFGMWLVTLVTLMAFGVRRPILLALYPLALSAALYLAFAYGFDMVLPTWI